MELEVMKKLIRKYEPGHTRFSLRAMQAERYYRNETDILVRDKLEDEKRKRIPTTLCAMQTTGFPGISTGLS